MTANETIRVGIVGLGANTRLRHLPGLLACESVEIAGVCNRRPESTKRAAQEFGIDRTYSEWQQLVADESLDAVLIGTWPYLHCPITLAALDAGKHVLTEARMAMNADEARRMLEASRNKPDLVTQIVPSPLGLSGHALVKQILDNGDIGELREVVVLGVTSAVADPSIPLHWRQSATYSGVNMLALGIVHETLTRWTPDPVRVMAQTDVFTKRRADPESSELAQVTTPDIVHVLAEFAGGARGIYHFSGVAHFAPALQIHLYGSTGTLKYLFTPEEQVFLGRAGDSELQPLQIPAELAGGWRVEEEFINAIRGLEEVRFTDFPTGARYMEFTQAVADSASRGEAVRVGEQ